MPLDEAHLEGFLFCTLWINKYTLKKYLLASGLDVAMVVRSMSFSGRGLNKEKKVFCDVYYLFLSAQPGTTKAEIHATND